MKKSAVIFMLLLTLLFAAVCTGCGGASSGSGGASPGSDGASSGSESASGSAGGASSGADAAAGQGAAGAEAGSESDPAAGSGDVSSIPDTNESAAGDWGVAESANAAGDSESIFSQVLVDNENLYFAIKNVRPNAAAGYKWQVYIENRTDRNLMFSFEKVAVNDVMCDPFWAEVITSGKKGNCEITWMRDELEELQITDVTRVDFTLNVYNDDDYTEAPLMHDPFTVFPLGEEQAQRTQREPASTDLVLVDDDNCSVIITACDPDNSWGYCMKLYLVNKTDRDMVFSINDASINGVMCDPFWADIISAGKSGVSTVLWDRSTLAENGITQVEEISLPLTVYPDEDIGNPCVDETFDLTQDELPPASVN